MDNLTKLIEHGINVPDKLERLTHLREIKQAINEGKIVAPQAGEDVNNHIHTTYSFSPYSPTKALYKAWEAGLCTAGIMDHDSIAGAREFIVAGQIMGLSTTVGLECRVHFTGTPLEGRKINNPDQVSNAYVALHGVAHTQIEKINDFFAPFRAARNIRNRQMVEKINIRFGALGIEMDFEKDVLPLSQYADGGTVTERHISYALAQKLMQIYGKGNPLIAALREKFFISLTDKMAGSLADGNNPNYAYDVLGVIKSDLLSAFYIPATDECPHITQVAKLAKETGAILAYAYLGDVGDSVTGDKKAQKFEDDYLDELFEVLKTQGFDAITYMPSRNTLAQLQRVQGLCKQHGFFEISGEDINSPRQSFICTAMRAPQFEHLKSATWALIGHEMAATKNLQDAMFSKETQKKYPDLQQRIEIYQKIGHESK